MENISYQRTVHKHKKLTSSLELEHQKGFALVALLSLMPLILAALTFLYIGTTQIEIKSTLQQTCRTELMKAQTTASSLLKTLMALNKLIAIVKWGELLAAIASIIVIANPLIAATIQGILATTKAAKKAIPQIQKAILLGLGPGMDVFLMKGHHRLSETFADYAKKANSLMLITHRFVAANYFRELSVEPEDPKSNLTRYRLKNDFESKQELFLQWHYGLKTGPSLFSWASWQQNFQGRCSATLKKEDPWEPTLYAGKSYLKFF